MTQENAAMSARTTVISTTLAQGADALAQLVSLFKLNRRTAQRDDGSSMRPILQTPSGAIRPPQGRPHKGSGPGAAFHEQDLVDADTFDRASACRYARTAGRAIPRWSRSVEPS